MSLRIVLAVLVVWLVLVVGGGVIAWLHDERQSERFARQCYDKGGQIADAGKVRLCLDGEGRLI